MKSQEQTTKNVLDGWINFCKKLDHEKETLTSRKRGEYMLDKVAEKIGVSTEALIKVIDAVDSKCPHDFGVPKDYEMLDGVSACVSSCEECWKKVVDKISTI